MPWNVIILEFEWRPATPPGYIALAALLLATVAFIAYRRTLRTRPALSAALLIMRLVAIASLTVLLMGPSVFDPTPVNASKGRLTILLDTSASMQTCDEHGRARFEAAAKDWLNPVNLDKLRGMFDVNLLAFDVSEHPLPPSFLDKPAAAVAVGKETKLDESLRHAMDNMPITKGNKDGTDFLLLSDGRDTRERRHDDLVSRARARGVRINTVCLGGTVEQHDLVLQATPVRDELLVGETGLINVLVYQSGFDGATTTLHVQSPGGAGETPVPLTANAATKIQLPIKATKPGLAEYRLRLDALPGETQTENNAQSVLIDVSGKRIKVLLLEGQPDWDTKFLAQALRQDERIELTVVSRLAADNRQAIVTRTDGENARVPATAKELADYDVLILGRGVASVMDAAVVAAIPEFVAAGGHLIFARGRAYEAVTGAESAALKALEGVEPVVWGKNTEQVKADAALALTPVGLERPLFASAGPKVNANQVLSKLPRITGVAEIAGLKPATQVLLDTGSEESRRPALVSMDYGRGSVLAVLAEGLWRWRLLPPALDEFANVYDSFWSNTVRWLALGGDFQPGQQVSFKLTPINPLRESTVTFDIAARWTPSPQYKPRLRVIGPSGTAQELALVSTQEHRWTASFPANDLGKFRAVLDAAPLTPVTQEKAFDVHDVDYEHMNLSADPETMRRLANETGGLFLRPDQSGVITRLLAAATMGNPGPGAPQKRWAWDNGFVLAIMLGWLGVEWLVRRRAGWL